MTKRQPSGTPVGGQFAEERKPESGDLVTPKKGKEVHVVVVYNSVTKKWSVDPEMLSRDQVVYDLDREDGEWDSFEGNEDLNGEATEAINRLLNPEVPSFSQTISGLIREQALEFFDADYEGEEGEYETSKAAFAAYVDAHLAEGNTEISDTTWEAIDIEANEIQRWFRLDGAVTDKATCILTGAEGENADDCTTHEHEEKS